MSRINEINEYRKKVNEVLSKSADTGENIALALLSSCLLEISDTLALMYDKMYEKEETDE